MDRRADSSRDPLSPAPIVNTTFVIPVYNEAENIEAVIAGLEAYAPPPFSVLVVYDFDEDTTVPVVERLRASRPWLRLLRNDLGRGVACALKKGFFAVESGPVVVVMGDLSDDLPQLPRMLDRYREGYDVVVASRYMRGGRQIGGPLVKRVLSQTAGVSLHLLAGFPVHDATNSFRLYDAALVHEVGIESDAGFEVAIELTAKAVRAGRAVCEVPAVWRHRAAGTSRFQLWRWLPAYLRWYAFAFTSAAHARRRRPAGRTPATGGARGGTRG